MENLLAFCALNLYNVWVSPIVVNCFSCSAVIVGVTWISLSAGLLYKESDSGLMKWARAFTTEGVWLEDSEEEMQSDR